MFVDLQNEEEDATDAYFLSRLGENKDEAALEKYFVPGSKRHPRTQSLKNAVENPSSKQYAVQIGRQKLEEMSEATNESNRYESAYVVDLVG